MSYKNTKFGGSCGQKMANFLPKKRNKDVMTRVVIFFNRGYLPTHMNYHDMITFRLRYTCVYFKSAPICSVYRYGFYFKSSLFDQRGIQEHSPGLLLPYVAVSSTCSHESFKVGLHREARHELLLFCLLTV